MGAHRGVHQPRHQIADGQSQVNGCSNAMGTTQLDPAQEPTVLIDGEGDITHPQEDSSCQDSRSQMVGYRWA